MTFDTAVPILFTSFVYRTNVYWSIIHGMKRKPHLSVVWNWYHFVAIAILYQPRPTDSADINTRLQLSDTSSIPPMHGGFLLKHCGPELSTARSKSSLHPNLKPQRDCRHIVTFCLIMPSSPNRLPLATHVMLGINECHRGVDIYITASVIGQNSGRHMGSK